MQQRRTEYNANSRYLGIKELCIYTSTGRATAADIGKKAGAAIRYGRRVIYDREKIDAFMQSLLETEAS